MPRSRGARRARHCRPAWGPARRPAESRGRALCANPRSRRASRRVREPSASRPVAQRRARRLHSPAAARGTRAGQSRRCARFRTYPAPSRVEPAPRRRGSVARWRSRGARRRARRLRDGAGIVTLVEGPAFAISLASGDMEAGFPHGVFYRDTRFLSELCLRVNGDGPNPSPRRRLIRSAPPSCHGASRVRALLTLRCWSSATGTWAGACARTSPCN